MQVRHHSMIRPERDAQDRLLWGDKTCPSTCAGKRLKYCYYYPQLLFLLSITVIITVTVILVMMIMIIYYHHYLYHYHHHIVDITIIIIITAQTACASPPGPAACPWASDWQKTAWTDTPHCSLT